MARMSADRIKPRSSTPHQRLRPRGPPAFKPPPDDHPQDNRGHVVRARLWEMHAHVCCWCGVKLIWQQATLEHLLPRAHGGATDVGNCALACKDCNNRRGAPTDPTQGPPPRK